MCDLSKKLAARPQFEWRGGMLAASDGMTWGRVDEYATMDAPDPEDYPDLNDPATQGVLWSMLVEATEADYAAVRLLASGAVTMVGPDPEYPHQVPWKVRSFPSVAHALLEVWS